jgi:hypothetical protein
MTFSEARVQYSTGQYNTVRHSTLSVGTEQGLRQKVIDKGQVYYNDIIMEAKLTKEGQLKGDSTVKYLMSTQ